MKSGIYTLEWSFPSPCLWQEFEVCVCVCVNHVIKAARKHILMTEKSSPFPPTSRFLPSSRGLKDVRWRVFGVPGTMHAATALTWYARTQAKHTYTDSTHRDKTYIHRQNIHTPTVHTAYRPFLLINEIQTLIFRRVCLVSIPEHIDYFSLNFGLICLCLFSG